MIIKRTEEEIYKIINKANDRIENGNGYFGMTYEDGVKAALEWVMGSTNESPFED